MRDAMSHNGGTPRPIGSGVHGGGSRDRDWGVLGSARGGGVAEDQGGLALLRVSRGGSGGSGDGEEDAAEGCTVRGWDATDDIMLLGLKSRFPDVSNSVVAAVYGEHRGEPALLRTLYALGGRQNRVKLKQLCDEFAPYLGHEEVKRVFHKTLNKTQSGNDGKWATQKLRDMVRKIEEGDRAPEGADAEKKKMKDAGADAAKEEALAELVEAYAPDVTAKVVTAIFCKRGKIVWKARMYLDTYRRYRGLSPVPFVSLVLVKGADVFITPENYEVFNKAHEPLRRVVADTYMLRDKAEKAMAEGFEGVAEWLSSEADKMREEEGAVRLKIAFRFFDTVTNPLFYNFVTDHARVAEVLTQREKNAQDARCTNSGDAMFRVDLHMQRRKDVCAVLDRAIRLIVHSFPEAKLKNLFDVYVDVLFGKGSHSAKETGPTLPGAVQDWLEEHDFMMHSKDVVEATSHLLVGYRLAVRNLQTEKGRKFQLALFRSFRLQAICSQDWERKTESENVQ